MCHIARSFVARSGYELTTAMASIFVMNHMNLTENWHPYLVNLCRICGHKLGEKGNRQVNDYLGRLNSCYGEVSFAVQAPERFCDACYRFIKNDLRNCNRDDVAEQVLTIDSFDEAINLNVTAYQCPICKNLVRCPVMVTKCQHIFCAECLVSHYRPNGIVLCAKSMLIPRLPIFNQPNLHL